MNILCVIPARGGSKRIPRKNIKPFLGKPIISYAISAAIESEVFSEIMVSSEDTEITSVAIKSGAKVPFKRSIENADDFSTTADVLLEVLNQYQNIDQHFEYACCIYPTAPFVTGANLREAFKILKEQEKDVVIPVLSYEHPIQRALSIVNGKLEMVNPENATIRSQDLPQRYHDSGQFYFFKVANFLAQNTLWMKNAGAIILSHFDAHDIDTPSDWKMAELKFEFRKES
ncbi:pseudaminic acid cytidylyltransferase [Portibacter lacus]|uniref:Pseudaminic acid cytidylyltransferase n=1 Tax=Portibacter lacus TaxID=1099794 RepID=A0AA37SQ40_9BACT|nr:pseudaminic acid cytidylyltransferase [Portibacter lacus]GLR18856.1 pseudaminic acid cytidylyltransferase [Portibacter lacus]